MSNMEANESDNTSKGILQVIVDKYTHLTKSEKEQLINKLNVPLRKTAHACEYLVLTILLVAALNSSRVIGKRNFIYAILICFLYACTDEYHQTFIKGRSGELLDVLVDTFGGFIGIIVIIIKNKLFSKKVLSKLKK